MEIDQKEMTAAIYSEYYEISQTATREALKEYDLSAIERKSLQLETKKNKASLVYKLFTTQDFSKTLIATTRINIKTKKTSVKVTSLDKKDQ